MNLQTKLLLGVLLTAIPVAAATTAWQARREKERSTELVRERTVAQLELVGREMCEAEPWAFPTEIGAPIEDDWLSDDLAGIARRQRPRDPAGLRYFVYDEELRPSRADAPSLEPRALERMREGRDSASWLARDERGHGPRAGRLERVLVRGPWPDSACAYVLVERPRMPGPGVGRRMFVPLVVTLSVVFALLLVAGPMVTRIRALTTAVRAGGVGGVESRGDDEIAELGRAFAERESTIVRQLEELTARESALREHLAAISHDVLLPITVLQGHLVELDRESREGRRVSQEALRGALEETDYVASLVRDLNAEARLRAGLPAVRMPLDLAAIVERVAGRHRMLAAKAGIELECSTPEEPALVEGDPTLVEQMLSNLVHNAVRYGRPGGHVAVVLDARQGRFSIDVLDDGPGVSEEALGRLGERGFRTDEARSRRSEGMGLGLHIAREVAAAHGFTLTFERNVPTGLAVHLRGQLAPPVSP